MMGEADGLRCLKVGETRHDGIHFFFGQTDDAFLHGADSIADPIDGITQVKPDVGSHLIVSGSAGVQFLADHTDFFR